MTPWLLSEVSVAIVSSVVCLSRYCVEGDIECDRLPCHPAPEGMNCTEVYEEGECCPSIQCIGEELPKPGSDSHTFEEYTTEETITTETSESSQGVIDTDSVTETTSEQQDGDEITSVGNTEDDMELTTTSLDLNEIEDVEVVTSPLEDTDLQETATSDSKLDNEELTTVAVETVEELTENDATTSSSVNKETTQKSNIDTEEASTDEASTEEASTEEANIEEGSTDEIDTTTSQGEIQFDDADEYGDDSFFDSCNYNGSVYENFEDVPSGDPCQLCQCFKGDVICAERECITPTGYENCRPLPATDGACCPSSWECDDNIETVSTTQSVIETTESSEEQTTGLTESATELPSNIESDTTPQIDNEQEAEGSTAVTSEDLDENVGTESTNNMDEETDKETLTTTINIEESQTETSQSLGQDLEESSGISEITSTSSTDLESENQTESSTDIVGENVTSSESENGENQTTETITNQENEESEIISTTENDLESLPEAECDPTTCLAPAGYEFC
jgi:hypothetical protein